MNFYEINTVEKKSTSISDSLVRLAKRLIRFQTDNLLKEQMLMKLLISIDQDYFQVKFQGSNTLDYESILKIITDYYNDSRKEKIKKIFIVKSAYSEKFVHIFQLVIDLAFHSNESEKERYVSEIIEMGDIDKEVLFSYVQELTKRNFVMKLAENDMTEVVIDEKQEQYQELQEHFEELKKNYLQLLESHNNLKAVNEKLNTDNSQLISQRDEFLSELGITHSLSFLQLAEKYKRDFKEYEMFIERLNKQLEEKTTQLKSKEEQLSKMSTSLDIHSVEKSQIKEVLQKNKELQELLIEAVKKEGEMREEVGRKAGKIEKLEEELEEKEKEVKALNKYKEKYLQVKSAHGDFKRNFMERMAYTREETKASD